MTVTAAILAILAGLVPLVVVLIKRWLKRRDEPARKLSEAHRAVAQSDATTVNLLLDDAIRRRPPLAGGPAPGAAVRGPESFGLPGDPGAGDPR